jgi:hypothetical protein
MNYRICILILAGLVLAGFARGKEDWNANGAHFGRQRKAVSSRRLFRAKNWLRDDVVQQQEVSHQRQTVTHLYSIVIS